MAGTRRRHSPEIKLKAVLEVLKGEKTANQIAGELGVHPVALSEWKRLFTEHSLQIFAGSKRSKDKTETREKAELYEQIGRLKMEVEWFKKKLGILS